jgi:hypothetical protein
LNLLVCQLFFILTKWAIIANAYFIRKDETCPYDADALMKDGFREAAKPYGQGYLFT